MDWVLVTAQANVQGFDKFGGEVNPTVVGMVVIVLLQLSAFFFQLRRSWGQDEAAKKADLTALEKKFEVRVKEVEKDVESLGKVIEHKLEEMGKKSDSSISAIHDKVNGVAIQTSALVEAKDNHGQQLTSLSNKIDTLIRRRTS